MSKNLRFEIYKYDQLLFVSTGIEIQLTDAIETLNKTQLMFARKFKGDHYDAGAKFGFVKTSVESDTNAHKLPHNSGLTFQKKPKI